MLRSLLSSQFINCSLYCSFSRRKNFFTHLSNDAQREPRDVNPVPRHRRAARSQDTPDGDGAAGEAAEGDPPADEQGAAGAKDAAETAKKRWL